MIKDFYYCEDFSTEFTESYLIFKNQQPFLRLVKENNEYMIIPLAIFGIGASQFTLTELKMFIKAAKKLEKHKLKNI